jgi:hypothetical protein
MAEEEVLETGGGGGRVKSNRGFIFVSGGGCQHAPAGQMIGCKCLKTQAYCYCCHNSTLGIGIYSLLFFPGSNSTGTHA